MPSRAWAANCVRSTSADLEVVRKSIVAEVVGTVRSAQQPVPLEALADRAVRVLGHDKTVGSGWGGAGSFRDLLTKGLPQDVKLSAEPAVFAYEPTRQISREIDVRTQPQITPRAARPNSVSNATEAPRRRSRSRGRAALQGARAGTSA